MFTVLALCTYVEAPSAGNNAEEIVRRVKKTLDDLKTFSCSFERVYVWKAADRTQHIAGNILMKKPYKLRIEYPGHTIVIDGKSVWSYLPQNMQVQISTFEGEEESFPSPHSIFNRYSTEREAVFSGNENVNGSECDIIDLLSPDPEDVQITVWIDRKLHFPVKAVEKALSGDVTTHVLSDVRLKENIDDDVFDFVPPEGVTVIDMRG